LTNVTEQLAVPFAIARLESGTADEFAVFFNAWMAAEQRRVFSLCQRLLQDPDEANSATQDTFLKAYQALRKEPRQLEDPARWLTRIAVNSCLDRLRSRKWRFWRKMPVPKDEGATLAMMRSSAPEAEDRYFAAQISSRLTLALDRLSARQRAVFTLRHYDDLSLDEIGQLLGLDVGTVKAHMFRAVSKLREELRDLYEGSR
jgi:RNA polymerase sigma-70 factor (ECF subfamily)